jgi:hypothetical protein
MGKRSYSGGTTALVIVLTLVIILIGVGFFFGMKIIGGGNELQHATDSGNLNVAKQALRSPAITFNSATEANEFGDLVDPANARVDLLVYDRLVGKATIVALNAAAEGTTQAAANAQAIYNMVQGQNGIGSRLSCELAQHGNLEGHFTNLSGANSTRMLQNSGPGQVTANPNETAVSYMARTKASNVYLAANQLPPACQSFLTNPANVAVKDNKNYLTGYSPLQCGLAGVQPLAVPMRPGEQPHLVDVNDFQKLVSSPLGGNTSQIPPNAFRSGGVGVEGTQTGQNMTMRSCAIVGTLNQDFPISVPRGYIVVDNTGSMNYNGTTYGSNSALAKVMMRPSYIGLVAGTPSGDIFGAPDKAGDSPHPVEDLATWVNDPANDGKTVPSALLSQIDSPAGLTSDQAIAALKGKSVTQCDDHNSISGGTDPNNPPIPECVNDYGKFLAYFGANVPTTTTTANNIMAVEAFKCYVLQVRASVGSDGCGSAVAPQACTGLKQYNIHGQACLPCNFASVGSLSSLLTDAMAPGAAGVPPQLKVRMYQIKPTATDAEINSCVMNQAVAMGATSYIYMGTDGKLTLTTTPPPFPINATAQPDGNAELFDTGIVDLNGSIVNVPSCEGYTNPWDCPALPANGQNKIQWTPSSGYNNLMGVLKFNNCASGGGDWCCPC